MKRTNRPRGIASLFCRSLERLSVLRNEICKPVANNAPTKNQVGSHLVTLAVVLIGFITFVTTVIGTIGVETISVPTRAL